MSKKTPRPEPFTMFHIVKNLAKHSAIYGLGDLLSKSIGFLMIPLYTHYLTTAQYGTMELLDLTSYIVGMLLAMGISQSVVRYYYEYPDEERRQQVISVALITVWVAAGAALIPLLIFSKDISSLVFKSADNFQFFNLVFISLLLNMSNDIPMTLLRIKQKSVPYLIISTCRLIINLSLNILLIAGFQMGIMGVLLSNLISSVLMGIFLLIYMLRGMKLTYSFEIAKSMIGYSFPLIGSWLGMYVLNFADRFFLQRMVSLADVGVYSLAYKFGMMPNALVLGPFSQIWAPKRFELVKEPGAKQLYALVFTYFWFVQLFLGLGIASMIKDAISIVAGSEYREAYMYVPLILMSYMCYGAYSYFQFGLLLEKKTARLASITISAAIINTAANYLLIPILHIWGAAIATLLSFVYLSLTIQFLSQRLYYIPYQIGRLIKMTATAVTLYGLASLIQIPNPWISIVIKFLVATSFPFILYLLKFFTHEEIEKLSVLRNLLTQTVKSAPSRLMRLGNSSGSETK
jgi:O-antigen/teichoic acid export membrane protein